MTRVKICGITSLQDAYCAVDSGADALGFVFASESPRCVAANRPFLTELTQLPPFVSRVAVCVFPEDLPPEWVYLFDTIQFYRGDCDPSRNLLRAIRGFQVRSEESIDEMCRVVEHRRPSAILLDSFDENRLGGTGHRFDWALAAAARGRVDVPVILAGGLREENVGDAIRQVRPYAVDVSSSVEAAPGTKDPRKVAGFIGAVRAAEPDAATADFCLEARASREHRA
ncbi:MAG TPA: phosphoribosylanthranilate isomerase [Chthonomonadales bacterium]|nr:phosphoribosylanthranilate isomerase [Chthonomonadales bacterium]